MVDMDISTISRVANSKHVATPYGTFLLKYFFSESLTTKSGEEVSTREVKTILNEAISKEDKTKLHLSTCGMLKKMKLLVLIYGQKKCLLKK